MWPATGEEDEESLFNSSDDLSAESDPFTPSSFFYLLSFNLFDDL